ncbi:hypothetical protein ACFPA8_16080 [Streptomyces ovatisporus]|uniref:Right-handed parallel beta-helix repeat-containing protein n=1 Tax=Streptomyces ovatisporus TaxID=1128682 RepID=A0ABV9AAL7_9ACTN
MTDTPRRVALRRVTLTAVTGLGLCLTLLPAGQAQAQAQAPARVPCNDVAALRTAIGNANTDGGTIALAPHCVYTLTAADNPDDGLPEITGKVRITGNNTTIQRAQFAPAFRIFHVGQGGSLSLDSLTVRGGQAPPAPLLASNGGAVYNDRGRVALTDTTVRNNSSSWLGGGIWNSRGTLVLRNTTVRDNTSENAGGVATNGTMTMRGGALRDNTGTLWAGGLANAGDTTLTDVSVDGNHIGGQSGSFLHLGGGIMTMQIDDESGPLRLNATRVRGNIAQGQGGGILIGADEPTTLYRSVVTRNAANGGPGSGGGIYNSSSRFGLFTNPVAGPERTSSNSAKQTAEVNLIRSAVFKNTPDNCAPPNSVPRCDAVGSAPATNTPEPGRN